MNTKDNWDHSNDNMRCATCLWSHRKTDGTLRCRAHAPTTKGFPVMFNDDWCGEHKLDGRKMNRPDSGATLVVDGEARGTVDKIEIKTEPIMVDVKPKRGRRGRKNV